MSKGKILFQLSGSIACFKACQLISQLVKAEYELEIVATKAALAFVGEATLEGLTGRRVHVAAFAAGEYMSHIHLIRWADLAILCPASANTLAKLASGLGDDLVSALFLAHDFKKPYLIAPAMNSMMLHHPATQASLARLASWGAEILGSGSGSLACGETGDGRLLEPDVLFAAIEARLARPSGGAKVLVTSGGTREPIDGVRSIVNTSTGRTGAAIAQELAREGFDVTILRSVNSQSAASGGVREVTYDTFRDLESQLRAELGSGKYAAVVHAAAVSDYSLNHVVVDGERRRSSELAHGKVDSGEELTLTLKRNPKLIDHLREFAKSDALKVIAFKLTNGAVGDHSLAAVRALASRARPDLVVHNDLSEINERGHAAQLFRARTGEIEAYGSVKDKSELARALATFLKSSHRKEGVRK